MQRRNAYTCTICRGRIITIDTEGGTTPMLIACRATQRCKGMMASHWYCNIPDGEPTFEWRKPTKGQYKRLSTEMKDHVRRGGLLIYPYAQTSARKILT